MWHGLLRDFGFFELLCMMDCDLDEKARSERFSCGGRFHEANYPRKPRGGPAELRAARLPVALCARFVPDDESARVGSLLHCLARL